MPSTASAASRRFALSMFQAATTDPATFYSLILRNPDLRLTEQQIGQLEPQHLARAQAIEQH